MLDNVYADCVVCHKPIHHTPAPDPVPECPHCGAKLEWKVDRDADGIYHFELLSGTLSGDKR